MVNTCVCCGRIIDEDTQICSVCSTSSIACPACGYQLKPLPVGYSATVEQILFSRSYRCTYCHTEWETYGLSNEQAVYLNRKF